MHPVRELKRVKAVCFDVGGTLIATHPSVGRIYGEVAAGFGLKNLDASALDRQFAEVWRHKAYFDYSQEAWYGIVRRTFGARAAELPAGFFPAVYERFAQPDVWRIYDDALPALDELASHGVPLAIVSNWDNRLRPLLAGLKLASYFDVIIPSCEVAFHKPDAVVFEMAIRQLGLPPENILHVGDHFREDVEGAAAAGLQALQLTRGRTPAAPHEIGSLLELPAIVETAGQHLLALGAPVA